ncbi:ribosomal maturation YjgA family protein [Leptolyngbya sp. NIES-2104]|uniref:ribosomal maturation YjgA family protein n=1 Tax=Leptolyngbya sp. NIES-2104 TaxID=1552121 RepID=UPI0006EC95E8|nr:DUF2809 domain-containing protein [Leptolyngbya sp. NIES-2104]GAP98405.1 hypothetical protein NIES2104_49600 [Leptolyngbya sp. NIES-2104]
MPYRLSLLLTIVFIVPLGYFVRFSPMFPDWFSDVFGSIAYQIFFIALVQFWFPKMSIAKTAIGVFLFSCAIEFLQLWKPPFLQAIRATLPGRLVLGNTFLWSDFPPYGLGCSAGWLWLKFLRRLP